MKSSCNPCWKRRIESTGRKRHTESPFPINGQRVGNTEWHRPPITSTQPTTVFISKQLKGLCYNTQSEEHAFDLLYQARYAKPVKDRQANIIMVGDIQRARRVLLPQETKRKRLLSLSSEFNLNPTNSIHPKSNAAFLLLVTQPPSPLNSYSFYPLDSSSSSPLNSDTSRCSPSDHSVEIETSSEHSINDEISSDAQGSGSNHEDCSCTPAGRDLVRKVQGLTPQDKREGMVVLCATRHVWSNRNNMCYQHLRNTAVSSYGLLNKVTYGGKR